MRFTISGKHITITQAVREHAERKTSKFPRYYDSINRVEVIIEGNEGGKTSVEIIASAEHNKVFVVRETAESAFKGIDVAVHKLEGQLRKIKGKERDNKRADFL